MKLLCSFAGPQDRRGDVARLADDAVAQLDLLIDAGLSGSRSDGAIPALAATMGPLTMGTAVATDLAIPISKR